MNFNELLVRIDGRPVVLDENMLFSNLRQFLDSNHIRWRNFRKGITDEEIARSLKPGEVVITADRRFAYMLQDRAILVPLARSQYHQMQQLIASVGRRGVNPFNDISTCPICTNTQPTNEFTWWDINHMRRHVRRPYVPIHRRS